MPTLKRFDEDAYRTECGATVAAAHPEGIELDQTVFYARSGGQAGDTGTLILPDSQTVAIADTLYSADRPGRPGPAGARHAGVRRHRLGAPVSADAAAHLPTSAGRADPGARHGLRHLAGRRTHRLRPARIHARPRDADRATERTDQPRHPGAHRPDHAAGTGCAAGAATIRIVEIEGIDRQPCGGTHVRATGEIGRVLVTRIEKKSRQNRRVVVTLAD